MPLGFVSAILADLSLEQVFSFAAEARFACVELMCWPPGAADRRYAGVTHLDVTALGDAQAERVRQLVEESGVAISGLGYYPNPLAADAEHRRAVAEHLKKVMDAAARLGVPVVNTFIGRDHTRHLEAQWHLAREVWAPLVAHAEKAGVKLGIENCPMLFSADDPRRDGAGTVRRLMTCPWPAEEDEGRLRGETEWLAKAATRNARERRRAEPAASH